MPWSGRSLPMWGMALLLCLAGQGHLAAQADMVPTPVTASPISQFRLGSDETRFGKLEFLGGLVLGSSDALFGSVSSIRFLDDGTQFVSVLDTGHWLRGRVQRDPDGRLAGLTDVRITSMTDALGRLEAQKYFMDSEGVAVRGAEILVSYERKHRVDVYPAGDFERARPVGTVPILIPEGLLRANGGLETVVTAPKASPLQGAAVIVAERSVDESGNLLAAILDGPRKGRFSVAARDAFAVSDGTFLPSGDLLLLERRFNLATGVAMRIRRIRAGDLVPGAVVEGDVLIEATMADQIDNMEGIDALPMPDGSLHLILVSDDNHSVFQRTLMLEFRLDE